MSLDKFVEMYLDWKNNFLTVSGFAAHYEISLATAEQIIRIGREITEINLEA